jgi:hypothetical protein
MSSLWKRSCGLPSVEKIFNLINGEEYFEKDTLRIHGTRPMLETSPITSCLLLSYDAKPYTRKDENASQTRVSAETLGGIRTPCQTSRNVQAHDCT